MLQNNNKKEVKKRAEVKSKTDLHQGKLLFAGVVVSCGSLILFSIVRAFLVGVFVRGMHQLPRVLHKTSVGKYMC